MFRSEGVEGLGILTHKKTEDLSGGAFERYEMLSEEARTGYVAAQADAVGHGEWAHQPARLGLGYVQAILSVLAGCIQTCSFDAAGTCGRITVLRGGVRHDLSWKEGTPRLCMQGGFAGGTPNYHVATLGIAQCLAMALCGDREQSREFIGTWEQVLTAMTSISPREGTGGWTRPQIAQACKDQTARLAVLHACDALRAAMQYCLHPTGGEQMLGRREVLVVEENVLGQDEGREWVINGAGLLERDLLLRMRQDVPSTNAPPRPVEGEPDPQMPQNVGPTALPSAGALAKEATGAFAPDATRVAQGVVSDGEQVGENGAGERRARGRAEEAQQSMTAAQATPSPPLVSPLLAAVHPFLSEQPATLEGRPPGDPSPRKFVEEMPTLYLSPSSLTTALACEHRFRLKYVDQVQVQQSAAAWFGTLAHDLVEQACYGKSLQQSHDEVWRQTCPAIAEVLQDWLVLEREYRDVLLAQREEKVRGLLAGWHKMHPDYLFLKKQIQDYQSKELTHLRWYSSASLADYYRRSALLVSVDPSLVILDHLVIVEGAWLPTEGGSPPRREGERGQQSTAHEGHGSHSSKGQLLECTIGGIRFRGRPDYVAFTPDGEVVLADLKTGKKKSRDLLMRDLQLCIYREMLWQNEIVDRAQGIRSGHIYLTDDGVEHLWDERGALHHQVLRRVEWQARLLIKRVEAREFQPVFGTPHEVCSRCDYADTCEWVLAA